MKWSFFERRKKSGDCRRCNKMTSTDLLHSMLVPWLFFLPTLWNDDYDYNYEAHSDVSRFSGWLRGSELQRRWKTQLPGLQLRGARHQLHLRVGGRGSLWLSGRRVLPRCALLRCLVQLLRRSVSYFSSLPHISSAHLSYLNTYWQVDLFYTFFTKPFNV